MQIDKDHVVIPNDYAYLHIADFKVCCALLHNSRLNIIKYEGAAIIQSPMYLCLLLLAECL